MVARVAGILCVLSIVSLSMVSASEVECGSYWTFDEADGLKAYDRLSGYDGTISGAQRLDGPIGSALWFDGEDDYVALPDNSPVWLPRNDFSIAFWVYFKRKTGLSVEYNDVLVDLNYAASSNPNNELGCCVNRRAETGEIVVSMTTAANTDDNLYSHQLFTRHRWYHIAAVRRGSELMLYVDGELDAQRKCTESPVRYTGGYDDGKVNIGRFTSNVGLPRYHFCGALDELLIVGRALSASEVAQLCKEPSTFPNYYVGGPGASDDNAGWYLTSPFSTIQKAIDVALDGAVIHVASGVYEERIDFRGKAITVEGLADAPTLEAPDGVAVSFCSKEGSDSILRNFVIANSDVAVLAANSAPTLTNLTIVGNTLGIEAHEEAGPCVSSCIFWDNADSDLFGCEATYSCIERETDGLGNFSADPLFANADGGDYHLRSEYGRYWPEYDVWVLDDVTSPCLDTGDPDADASAEGEANGGRVNIGAYGGTPRASRSAPQIPGMASNPTPANGGVLDRLTLSWTPDAHASSHDVYFGDSYPPPFVGNQTECEYEPWMLLMGQTYWWRIDERNSAGVTIGEDWCFTVPDW